MDVGDLPRWAIPFPDESRGSWLAATRQCLCLDKDDWAAWVHASALEPDRPAADAVEGWHGLPQQLGAIGKIPPCWRLGPAQRHVYCDHCSVGDGAQRRWPTCVPWLDARRLVCSRHDRMLVYLTPSANEATAPDVRAQIPEVAQLCQWLADWLALDQRGNRTARRESLWRRDLVTVAMRNWSRINDVGAYALPAWEMQAAGWNLPGCSKRLAPGLPGRLGHLPPLDRIGGLLMAFRYWNRLEGRSHYFHPLFPANGWAWFSLRWCERAGLARRQRMTAIWEATEHSKHARLLSCTKASRRRPH